MAGVRKTAGHQTAEAAGLQIVKVNWNFALVPLYVPVVAASVVLHLLPQLLLLHLLPQLFDLLS